jgi:CBS domain-containing protein
MLPITAKLNFGRVNVHRPAPKSPHVRLQARSMKITNKPPPETPDHPQPWKLFPLLQNTLIGQIVNPEKPVVTAREDDKVSNFFRELSKRRQVAGLVHDLRGRPTGFVDTLDILTDITHNANISDLSKPMSSRLEILKAGGHRFAEQKVIDIMNESKRDPLVTLTVNDSVFKAAQELTSAHRILIADVNMWHMLDQLDIISFLLRRRHPISAILHKNLKEIGLEPKPFVGALDQEVSTMGAMRFIRDGKMTGIAVIDDKLGGRLVSNFSASDILGLKEDQFDRLALPIREFLLKQHGYIMPAITAMHNDTLEALLFRMSYYGVHRVYMSGTDMKPTGIISVTDVMKFLSKATD